jgi:hypothetical protein
MEESTDTHWSVLVLGHNAAAYRRQNEDTLQHFRYEILQVDELARLAEEDLQSFYPEFMYSFPRNMRMGGLTLLELFRRKDGVNLWWFGEMCEKAPLRGPFLDQLFRLALLRRVLANQDFAEVWLHVGDTLFRGCVASVLESAGHTVRVFSPSAPQKALGWFKALKHSFLLRLFATTFVIAANLMLTRLVLALCRVTPANSGAQNSLVGLYSRYPVLWTNPYTEQQQERYFSHLRSRPDQQVEVAYFVLLSDWSWQLWKHRKVLKKVLSSQNIVPLALYLGFWEVVKASIDLGMPMRYLKYRRRIAPAIHVEFCGWDISRLVDAEVRRTFSGSQIPQNSLFMLAVRNLTSKVGISVMLNPLEFQPMERAIWLGAKERTKTLAVQHSTFCRNHLMYYFKKGELACYSDNAVPDSSPVPDYYAVSGLAPRDIMLTDGVAPERIALCGAIRYNDLPLEEIDSTHQGSLRESLGMPLDSVIVLVLPSIFREESIDLVESLAQVVAGLSKRFALFFKCHYHCRIEDRIKSLFSPHNNELVWGILSVDGPLYDYIRAADVVITGGTTVAVEVLALGRLPVVYRCPTLLNLSPLMDYPGCARFVSSPEDIVRILEQAANEKVSSKAFLSIRNDTIEKLFYRLDGKADERLVSFLQDHGLVAGKPPEPSDIPSQIAGRRRR